MRAQPLVADLSEHLLAITTGFTGARVLLFGAVEEPGEVVVVVRGPSDTVTMRRKSRVAGIWMNTSKVTFPGVPTFYAVSTSGPLHQITTPAVRSRNRIGVSQLDLRPKERDLAGPELVAWQEGLIRAKQRKGHYAREAGRVVFLGRTLFRTELFFPATVPTGHYQVEVYLLDEGEVVSAQTTPLIVSKAGLEAEIFQFAHNRGALYGILAVMVAALAGWLASVIFRRD
ncbi:TIGR02186 family protein [Limimonas halophila]|uniref:TIGR02186 family protein n=1 Tax=Limimonas halophila TaxID=1082479 RepID=UPI001C40B63F|nr:TIGR02186 family protein [Limimonas halophila]